MIDYMKNIYKKHQLKSKLNESVSIVNKNKKWLRSLIKNDLQFNIIINDILTKTNLITEKWCYDSTLINKIKQEVKNQDIVLSKSQEKIFNQIEKILIDNETWINNSWLRINMNDKNSFSALIDMLHDQTLPTIALNKIFYKLLENLTINIRKDWFEEILKLINLHPNVSKKLLHEILELNIDKSWKKIIWEEIDLVYIKKFFINNSLVSLKDIMDLKTTPYFSLWLKAIKSKHLTYKEIEEIIKEYPREILEWKNFIEELNLPNKKEIIENILRIKLDLDTSI